MSLRSSGQLEASKLVKEIISSSPSQSNKNKVEMMSGKEALAMIIDAKLSRHQYAIIRSKDKMKFPSYEKVLKAKQECYPNKDNIVITSTHAEVKLQALLDHTVSRLLVLQKDVLKTLNSEKLENIVMISKWGFDGFSGNNEYKQKFELDDCSDSSVFMSSLVPIQLVCNDPKEKDLIIWQNPRTSSTRFSRPIKFQFIKESNDVIISEKTNIQKQIDELLHII